MCLCSDLSSIQLLSIFFQWGSTKNLLAVNTIANVFMLSEHVMSANFQDQVKYTHEVKNMLFVMNNEL